MVRKTTGECLGKVWTDDARPFGSRRSTAAINRLLASRDSRYAAPRTGAIDEAMAGFVRLRAELAQRVR